MQDNSFLFNMGMGSRNSETILLFLSDWGVDKSKIGTFWENQ
jgi:hypothetical protein